MQSLDLTPYMEGAGAWVARAFEEFEPGSAVPIGSSKLCIVRAGTAVSQFCAVSRDFNYVDDLSVVSFASCGLAPRFGILYVAKAFARSGGYRRRLTLWTLPSRTGAIRDLLPDLDLSNRGAYRFLAQRDGSCERFLATAESIGPIVAGDARVPPRFFTVRLYRYETGSGGYRPVVSYKTAKPYDHEDVLSAELGAISKIMATR